MAQLPTPNERIDAVLDLARTRASAYADDGNPEMAYKTLLRGVRSAQRANNSGQTGLVVRTLWANPAVKVTLLGATPALIAAVTRSRSKSDDAAASTRLDSSGQRARFRVHPRRHGGVVIEDQTRATTP